jgi:hypothetical protein
MDPNFRDRAPRIVKGEADRSAARRTREHDAFYRWGRCGQQITRGRPKRSVTFSLRRRRRLILRPRGLSQDKNVMRRLAVKRPESCRESTDQSCLISGTGHLLQLDQSA